MTVDSSNSCIRLQLFAYIELNLIELLFVKS